jgi:hypothetical protein
MLRQVLGFGVQLSRLGWHFRRIQGWQGGGGTESNPGPSAVVIPRGSSASACNVFCGPLGGGDWARDETNDCARHWPSTSGHTGDDLGFSAEATYMGSIPERDSEVVTSRFFEGFGDPVGGRRRTGNERQPVSRLSASYSGAPHGVPSLNRQGLNSKLAHGVHSVDCPCSSFERRRHCQPCRFESMTNALHCVSVKSVVATNVSTRGIGAPTFVANTS